MGDCEANFCCQDVTFREQNVRTNKILIHSKVTSYNKDSKKEKHISKAFDEIDGDINQKASEPELTKYFQKHFELSAIQTASLASKCMQKFDNDKDGELNFLEFSNAFDYIIDYMKQNKVKEKFPWAMVMMSLIQVAIFWCDYKYESTFGVSEKNAEFKNLIRETLKLKPCINDTELWRPGTYMFVHADWFHLVSNIVIQMLSVTCFLEAEHKPQVIYLIYFSGVFVGGLGHLAWNCTPLVGCSGGVFALIAASLSFTILNWKQLPTKYNQCVLFLTVLVLVWSYVCGDDNVSHSCHIFGAISGLLTGYFLLKNLVKNEKEEWCIKVAIALFVLLVVGLLAGAYFRNYLHCKTLSKCKFVCGKP